MVDFVLASEFFPLHNLPVRFFVVVFGHRYPSHLRQVLLGTLATCFPRWPRLRIESLDFLADSFCSLL